MNAIWRRLSEPGKYWRHVYKALLLIDYLIKNGSEQVIRECRANVVHIQTLMEFQHIDENDKDVGLSGECFFISLSHFVFQSSDQLNIRRFNIELMNIELLEIELLSLVRERAKIIAELLHDEKRIKGEREKAKQNARKYLVGMGSDTPSWGGGMDYSDRDDRRHDSYRDRDDRYYCFYCS